MTQSIDILEQLQCMVNTETPTPLHVVNQMLDLIPESVWLDDNAKILCPACKDGIFLRESVVRILKAKYSKLNDKAAIDAFTSNKENIVRQILKDRIFGIAVSYRGYRVTQRTLYTCNPAFAGINNIFFDESLGEYVRDKSGAEIEKQAFHFIRDTQAVARFFAQKGVIDMKFDVIIGNPPYQLTDGSGASSDAALPIYNKFIEQAIKLSPNFLSMIIPSKWMVGGRGLSKFRETMSANRHLKELYDFESANDCFPGRNIDGGICYFLWDKTHDKKLKYVYTSKNGNITINNDKQLRNKYFDFIIRDERILTLLNKIPAEKAFSEIISSTKPYGIRKDLFNAPDRYPKSELSDKEFPNCLKVYGVKGIKGGARRTTGYINRKIAIDCSNSINKYKLFFTTTFSTNAIIPPEIIKGSPNEICTETFLLVGPFDNKTQQENCFSYMNTNFFRLLLYYGKGTMQVTKNVFKLIPLQDFSEEWTDEKLFKKYNFDESDIEFIKSIVSQ